MSRPRIDRKTLLRDRREARKERDRLALLCDSLQYKLTVATREALRLKTLLFVGTEEAVFEESENLSNEFGSEVERRALEKLEQSK
jgi:hypothetical protein